jgi:hypothetical protein
MVKIIIRGVPDRQEYIDYLNRVLPEAVWCMDTRFYTEPDSKIRHMKNFIDALMMGADTPCVHMEEDIIITKDFINKLNNVITQRPNELIQFFSMRGDDIKKGSRYDNNYIMNQCFYLPAGYGRHIAEYYTRWDRLAELPSGSDLMINDWLKTRKEKYWIHVPSLVEHRVTRSMIEKRRPQRRQSKTFIDPVL